MSSISSISSISLDSAVVALSATPDSAAVDRWVLSLVTASTAESCVYHVRRVGPAATIYFSPRLSPGVTYRLTVTTTTGGADTTSTQTFATPAAAKPPSTEWSHGIIRAWSRAIGQALNEMFGAPSTLLTQDLSPSETTAYVESTLGFPDAGYVFVGPRRYRYTARTPASLTGLTPDFPIEHVVRRRHVVVLDVCETWPLGGMRYLTASGRAHTDPNGVL